MPSIATSSDGAYIYLALEDTSGFPVFVRAARTDLNTWSAVYSPGAGSAANVASVPGNPDRMLFFGYMGSGIQVVSHVISTGVETNISPAGLTTKIANCLVSNPSDPNELIITVNTDFDLLYSANLGTAWSTLYASLTFNATGLAVKWDELARVFVGGKPALVQLLYSPNEGSFFSNLAGAALGAVANITNIEIT